MTAVETPETQTESSIGSVPKVKIINLFLLDKSGSMQSIRDTIISGFNEQIDDIKKLDAEQGTESLFGLVEFTTDVNIRYLSQPTSVAQKLNHGNYNPSGGTSFYDAIVDAIKAQEDKIGSELTSAKVLVTVLTDGDDTSSRRFTASQAADLIKQFQNDYGWTFTFMGAEIDVEGLAARMNVPISNTLSFTKSSAGTNLATETLKMARSAYYSKSLNGEDTSKSFFHADK